MRGEYRCFKIRLLMRTLKCRQSRDCSIADPQSKIKNWDRVIPSLFNLNTSALKSPHLPILTSLKLAVPGL
jgi:hypothetical protein